MFSVLKPAGVFIILAYLTFITTLTLFWFVLIIGLTVDSGSGTSDSTPHTLQNNQIEGDTLRDCHRKERIRNPDITWSELGQLCNR